MIARGLLRWGPPTLLAWVGGGASALVAALVAIAVLVLGVVPPRWLLAVATALMALVPLAWWWQNDERLGQVNFSLVTGAPLPGQLALVALVWLAVAVYDDVLAQPSDDQPSDDQPSDDQPSDDQTETP